MGISDQSNGWKMVWVTVRNGGLDTNSGLSSPWTLFFILNFQCKSRRFQSPPFDRCLSERCIAVNTVNKPSVSLTHICLSYMFPAESLYGFSPDFSCFSLFMFSGILFWLQAILFCISMYCVWWRNTMKKTGKTSHRMITRKSFFFF